MPLAIGLQFACVEKQLKWLMGEGVIKQAIATMIPNSLFIEVCKEVTAYLMWEIVWFKQEKMSPLICAASCRRKIVLSMVICMLTLVADDV